MSCAALSALSFLTHDTENCDLMLDSGILLFLVNAIQHGPSRQAKHLAAVMLSSMLGEKRVKYDNGLLESLPALVPLLSPPTTWEQATDIAACFCRLSSDKELHNILVRAGVVPPCIVILQHPTIEALLSAATLIHNLSVNETHRQALVQADAVPALMALVDHADPPVALQVRSLLPLLTQACRLTLAALL